MGTDPKPKFKKHKGSVVEISTTSNERTPKCWLLYARNNKKKANWLYSLETGRHMFWSHGSDAYTKQVQPGDTGVLYLAGDEKDQGEIVGIFIIRSMRTPFIFDINNRQRIPCLLIRDFRDKPIQWKQIQSIFPNQSIIPASNQGGIQEIDDLTREALIEVINQPLPISKELAEELISSTDLWSEIEQFSGEYTVIRNYVTRAERKNLRRDSTDLVYDGNEFDRLLSDVWNRQIDTISTKSKPNQNEVLSDESEVKPDQVSKTITQVTSLTASSVPDIVQADAKDILDVELEAKAFARLIASTHTPPPLSIGIFGRWGSGKSFFMSKVWCEVDKLSRKKIAGFHESIVPIEFNAWHYMESNIWASLVEVIFNSLEKEISSRNDDSETPSLIEQLSSMQTMRIEAIENLASQLSHMRSARENLTESKKDFESYEPDGKQVWELIKSALKNELMQNDKEINKLGFEAENISVGQLRQLFREIHKNTNMVRALKLEAMSPKALGILALLFLAIIGLSLFFRAREWGYLDDLSEIFLLFTTTTVTWLSLVSKFAKCGISKLSNLKTKLYEQKELALEKTRSLYRSAQLSVEHAEQELNFAEKQVEAASNALLDESPASQLTAFITERAASDDYNKHLGVIASIRRDFEQLSQLMSSHGGTSGVKSYADTNKEKVKEYRKSISLRIQRLEKKYDFLFSEENQSTNELGYIKQAIHKLKESLKDNFEDKSPPFTRIVLMIDDLDRCPSNKVAEVLQAVHLFLNFPLFVVMVCVDERWMSSSLTQEFGSLVDGVNGATTSDYLEKIFQIPYWTRSMDSSACKKFARAVIQDLPQNQEQRGESSEEENGKQEEFINTSNAEKANLLENEVLEVKHQDINNPSLDDTNIDYDDDESLSTDSDDSEEKQSNESFLTLTLSDEEKTLLENFAEIAGDTPRRSLRFIRVYMLLKTSLQETEILHVGAVDKIKKEQVFTECLIFQLAIATRIDLLTSIYFEALMKYTDENPQESWSIESFIESFRTLCSSNKMTQLDEKLVTVVTKVLHQLSSKYAHSKLIENLKVSEGWARRYAFKSGGEL